MQKNKKIDTISEVMAFIGGIILFFIVAITTTNIFGRKIGSPLAGDIETVELLISISIFFFLPYCQTSKSNLNITIFSNFLPKKTKYTLDMIGILFYLLIAVLLCWRMTLGGIDLFNFNDYTMVLKIPKYYVFFPIIFSLIILCIVCLNDFLKILHSFNDK